MAIDERLEALTQSVESLALTHRGNEASMTRFQAEMTPFANGVNGSVTRLTRILEAHAIALDDHEDGLDKLEGRR